VTGASERALLTTTQLLAGSAIDWAALSKPGAVGAGVLEGVGRADGSGVVGGAVDAGGVLGVLGVLGVVVGVGLGVGVGFGPVEGRTVGGWRIEFANGADAEVHATSATARTRAPANSAPRRIARPRIRCRPSRPTPCFTGRA
jgi:hypothetical protein